jgi:hypothetical protein
MGERVAGMHLTCSKTAPKPVAGLHQTCSKDITPVSIICLLFFCLWFGLSFNLLYTGGDRAEW